MKYVYLLLLYHNLSRRSREKHKYELFVNFFDNQQFCVEKQTDSVYK